MKKHSHSRLRYLCTLGFPLIAAILTGLVATGLITSLLWRPLEVRVEAPSLGGPLNNENETSESVPVFKSKKMGKSKNKANKTEM